jgi:hypothetical protein
LNIKFNTRPYLPTLIAAVLLFIMVFLPWLTASASYFGYSISASQNGIHSWGILTFIMSIAAAGLSFITPQRSRAMFTLLAGVLALLGIVIHMGVNLGGGVGAGAGLIIALIVSLALIALAYMDYKNMPIANIMNRFKAGAKPPTQNPPPASPPPAPPAPPAQ